MAIAVFFNQEKSFDELAALIFQQLGVSAYNEGESSFSIGGYYYFANLLGLRIELAMNNYDYEDQYVYLMMVDKATGSKVDRSLLRPVAELIATHLSDKLDIEVGVESGYTDEGNLALKVFSKVDNEIRSELRKSEINR
ncbi:hypothetical protein [Acetonema longum]|uniref:Uncharacterized protein n=1 Tax=Acetonema longum DSM 6540 TaxID=1009370 RepID=F7NN77_9FIRM|nr:hypothetical protein [Acetonema longum]EGO62505.1 hypothetical protein ALO_17805 [Acetonema longum DSM 6540]